MPTTIFNPFTDSPHIPSRTITLFTFFVNDFKDLINDSLPPVVYNFHLIRL